jgi:serine/threonine protein kinase
MSLNKLGRYDIIRVLGKGAMGLVYEARDPNLDRRVAIKTIKVENLSAEAAAEYEGRFRTEARSAARLQHPNIVSVYDSDRHGDMAFLVMEFIQGEDLKHHLDAGRRYSLEESLGMVRDLLSALDYAHRQSIVHRDVKPANLLIEADGRVKLTDFGVARIQDSGEATRTQGSMVGTLKYMSPEQVQGVPIDARADLFAVGVVLYQLLTGKRPFDGDTDFAIIQQIVGHVAAAPSTFNTMLPPAIDAVVARALAKKRDERFATAQEFAQALQAASEQAADPTVVPPVSPPGRRGGTATDTGKSRAGSTVRLASPGNDTGSTGSTVTQELELVYWKDIKDSEDLEDLEVFLDKFPSGIYADLARRRVRKLGGSLSTEGSGTGTGTASMTLANPPEERSEWTRLQAQSESAVVASLPVAEAQATPAQDAEATQMGAGPVPLVATVPPKPEEDPTWTRAQPHPAVSSDSPTAKSSPSASTAGVQPARRSWVVPVAAVAGVVVLAVAVLVLKPRANPSPAAGAGAAPTAGVTPASAGATTVAKPGTSPTTAPPGAMAAPASGPLAKKVPPASALPGKPVAPKAVTTAKPGADATVPAPVTESAGAAQVQAAGPRQVCENRMLLGFQACMNEQCAKPAFSKHPVCVERRAAEERRREAQETQHMRGF